MTTLLSVLALLLPDILETIIPVDGDWFSDASRSSLSSSSARVKREDLISVQESSKHIGVLDKVNPDDFVDIKRGTFYQYGPSYIPYMSTFGDLWNVISECNTTIFSYFFKFISST